MNNIVFANLGYGNKTTTPTVFQYNMGMMLRFKNVTLPETYRVDFSNSLHGTSKAMIGGANGVEIPYEYFVPGNHIYAWIVLSTGENDAITEYQIEIPIDPRAKPTDVTPTPSQQSAIDQAIAALNDGVERAETAAETAESATETTGQDVIDANEAKEAAQEAQAKTEEAQEAAEIAQTAAETAQSNAQSYADNAAGSAQTATAKASEAAQSATDAKQAAEDAQSAQSSAEAAQRAAETAKDQAVQAVANVQETVDAALQEAKDSGEFDGKDGVSPVATVTQTDTGATITVTDEQGTTTAEISNGQDGEPGTPGAPGTDGISPTVTVTDITGGHRITITDADGAHSFDVMNGEDGQGAVQDVQVNGVSVLTNGVANVPIGSSNTFGVFKTLADRGISVTNGKLEISAASDSQIKNGSSGYRSAPTNRQHVASFYGLAKAAGDTTQSASSNAVGNYTDSAKSAIHEMLNGAVFVSGTTPVINALPGVRYVCGEVATLEIIVPASGCIDVTFESGTTATVLTVTPPTGVTLKWANGFDPDNLDADTTYEINICDGLGVAGAWS